MNAQKVLIFLSGAIIGGAIGAVGAIKYLDKTYQATLDKRVAEMEEYYGRVDEFNRDNYFDDDEVNPIEDEPETETGRDQGILTDAQRADIRERLNKNHAETTNYASMYHNMKGVNEIDLGDHEALLSESQHPEDDDEALDEETAADEDPAETSFDAHQRDRLKAPRIISAEKLGELDGAYEDKTLLFYMYDETLVTEEEDVVEDPERLIGDALTKYGFCSNDESVIYVQNFEQTTVYEIQKVWASYGD